MKILTVPVNSIGDYFTLPTKDRYFLGLYKIPDIHPHNWFEDNNAEEWESFFKSIKKQHRFQYFLREELLSFYFFKTIWFLRKMKNMVNNKINPPYKKWNLNVRKFKNSPIPKLLTESNFSLILDYYYSRKNENEHCFDEESVKFNSELEEYVEWIESGKNEEMAKVLKILSEDKVDYDMLYDNISNIESMDKKILHWFVDNVDFFYC